MAVRGWRPFAVRPAPGARCRVPVTGRTRRVQPEEEGRQARPVGGWMRRSAAVIGAVAAAGRRRTRPAPAAHTAHTISGGPSSA